MRDLYLRKKNINPKFVPQKNLNEILVDIKVFTYL